MRALIIQGLGWGDESKGETCDALARHLPVDVVVRFCGGAQAAHHVVLPDGRSHCFSQFGAGMLANNRVKTHLSRFMLVEPFAMMKEASALSVFTDDVWSRTTVDREAVVLTYFHRTLNQLREKARGVSAHGSCGRGIGVARELELKYPSQILRAGHIRRSVDETAMRLIFMYSILGPEINELSRQLRVTSYMYTSDDFVKIAQDLQQWPAMVVEGLEPAATMVFEGAQGVMLDEKHGTAPHNTWTNTTFENADTLLDEAGVSVMDRVRIGCLRTYHTRHGAGPFPTEDNTLDLPEPHNSNNGFQGAFRVGKFDFKLAAQAIDIAHGVDYLAISHLDYLPRLGIKEENFLEAVQQFAPVCMKGRGPTAEHRTIDLEVCV